MASPDSWGGSTGATGVDGALPWDDADRAALVAMMRSTGKNTDWSGLTERVMERGGARLLWEDDHPPDLFGANPESDTFDRAARDIAQWRTAPFRFHTFMDRSYPEQLRSVRRVPPVVFTWGRMVPGENGICVVGSRAPSERASVFARTVAQGLVDAGITVISGLAKGIDTAAHRAALEAGGRTVAVLGNGLDRVYPQENRGLQAEIARDGMLLTHFLPGYPPSRWSFPARNATMSAYGLATVIVEANEQSGTRIQAREAVRHGRSVILNSTVVHATTWGREMVGTANVHIADSPQDAIDLSRRIVHHRTMVSRMLNTTG